MSCSSITRLQPHTSQGGRRGVDGRPSSEMNSGFPLMPHLTTCRGQRCSRFWKELNTWSSWNWGISRCTSSRSSTLIPGSVFALISSIFRISAARSTIGTSLAGSSNRSRAKQGKVNGVDGGRPTGSAPGLSSSSSSADAGPHAVPFTTISPPLAASSSSSSSSCSSSSVFSSFLSSGTGLCSRHACQLLVGWAMQAPVLQAYTRKMRSRSS
mmetsp:Transcript_100078/g.172748  ORF Transcript_100078/g.172748 Transcript_100078/m.172748 type:complete len:212 (-) Transcript_100078:207-842(-)